MAMSLGFYWSTLSTREPALAQSPSTTLRLVSPPTLTNPRVVRVANCAASTNPATTKKREPRGITKPKPISPAMQDFLGVPEIPRTQALKQIWAYIKQHNLQDPENKKIIVCDDKLKKIFGVESVLGFLKSQV